MPSVSQLILQITAVDNASGALNKIEASTSKLGTTAKLAAAGGVAAFAAVMVSSVGVAANFEKAIDQVGAVAGATEEEMAGLSKTALRIGKDTAFSASEAAGAMEMLAQNGISVTDIMGGAADAAVALAAAGGTDLKTAADLASTSMAVWGLKTEDMTDVVNRMAGAANVSKFGVEDMAQAVGQGGGVAASAGVSFADFTTAIAATATSFTSGSDAGTSFKTFLNGLTPNSKQAKDAMKELGLMTKEGGNQFFDASGKLKSMAEISGLLNTATKDLTEQQKAQALETIFGSDAMRTAAALSQITTEQFQKMDDTMKNTDAAEVAAKRMDNFKGAMEKLRGTIETLQIQLGSVLLPILTQVANFFADNPQVIIAFAAVVGGVLVVALTAWAVAATAAAVATLAAAAPVLAVVAAIALLSIGIAELIIHWDEITAKVPILGQAFDAVKAVVVAAAGFMLDQVTTQIQGIIAVFQSMYDMILATVNLVVALFNGDWSAAWQAMKDIASSFIDLLVAYVQAQFGSLPGIIVGLAGEAASAAAGFAEGIYNSIVDGLSALPGQLEQIGRDAISDLWNGISSFDLRGNITSFINNSIPGAIRSLLGIHSPSSVMASIGRNIVDGLANGIKQRLPSLISAAASVKGVLWNAASGAAGTVTDALGAVSGVAGSILGAFHGGTDYVPRTGPYILQQGEQVIPAGGGSGGVTVNINGPVYARDPNDVSHLGGDIGFTLQTAMATRGLR